MSSCSWGPTLFGQPPAVQSLEFVGCKGLTDHLQAYIGLADDTPACYVVVRRRFNMSMTSLTPGTILYLRVSETG